MKMRFKHLAIAVASLVLATTMVYGLDMDRVKIQGAPVVSIQGYAGNFNHTYTVTDNTKIINLSRLTIPTRDPLELESLVVGGASGPELFELSFVRAGVTNVIFSEIITDTTISWLPPARHYFIQDDILIATKAGVTPWQLSLNWK